ncbi:MAG: hypothetical protein JWN56_965 [Sphingobacteriales bacterium]|nr:hypothetical protein [Sphingobacteriales bacterium]
MKKIVFLCFLLLLFAACSSNKLDNETALKLLQEKKEYPKVVHEEIYIADPEYAGKLLEKGLENDGLLTVQRTQRLNDVGKPLITFSEKATPYLLPINDEDKKDGIQRVKIAEEVLQDVAGVRTNEDGKTAVVEYKTAYRNISPFAKISQLELQHENTRKATFSNFDDGWRLVKN